MSNPDLPQNAAKRSVQRDHFGLPLLAWAGVKTRTSSRSSRAWDISVLLLLFVCCCMQVYFTERSADFTREDVAYYEFAQSLLKNHTYALGGTLETTQPPGLALVIAFLCRTVGSSHTVILRSLGVLLVVGFLATYLFLRRTHGPAIAGVVCIIVAFSPQLFSYTTVNFVTAVPYLIASMLALLSAAKLEDGESGTAIILWQSVLAVCLVASILCQTSGAALIGAIMVWLAYSFRRDRRQWRKRLLKFLPPVAIACLALVIWMHRGSHQVKDWPVAGYPGSYMSQLVLKKGNYPELGRATPWDYVVRFSQNLEEYFDQFVALLSSQWTQLTWSAFVPTALLLLALLGLVDSILLRGSTPADWYFLFYAAIYLLWPWPIEIRFCLPVIPFLCVYVIDGARAIHDWLERRPTAMGAIGFPVFAALATDALFIGLRHQSKSFLFLISSAIWAVFAIIAVWIVLRGKNPLSRVMRHLKNTDGGRQSILGLPANRALAISGIFLLGAYLAVAISKDVRIGLHNLEFQPSQSPMFGDIQAAEWLSTHAASDAVVMARHVPIVFHYVHRKVVWFPSSSSPKLLMAGIRRHSISYVVVVSRGSYYYLPPETDCFRKLRDAYPDAFARVDTGRNFEIYAVRTSE